MAFICVAMVLMYRFIWITYMNYKFILFTPDINLNIDIGGLNAFQPDVGLAHSKTSLLVTENES